MQPYWFSRKIHFVTCINAQWSNLISCFFILFPVYVSEWLIHDNYYNCPTVNYKNLPVIYLFLLVIGKQYLFQCCQGCSGGFDILSILSCFFHCRQNLQIILLPSDKFSQIYSRLILMYFFRSRSFLGFSFCQDYGTWKPHKVTAFIK